MTIKMKQEKTGSDKWWDKDREMFKKEYAILGPYAISKVVFCAWVESGKRLLEDLLNHGHNLSCDHGGHFEKLETLY